MSRTSAHVPQRLQLLLKRKRRLNLKVTRKRLLKRIQRKIIKKKTTPLSKIIVVLLRSHSRYTLNRHVLKSMSFVEHMKMKQCAFSPHFTHFCSIIILSQTFFYCCCCLSNIFNATELIISLFFQHKSDLITFLI